MCSIAAPSDCPVCYESIGNANFSVTKCGHVFCTDCFVGSAMKMNACPMCRQEIYSPSLTPEYDSDSDSNTEYDDDDQTVISTTSSTAYAEQQDRSEVYTWEWTDDSIRVLEIYGVTYRDLLQLNLLSDFEDMYDSLNTDSRLDCVYDKVYEVMKMARDEKVNIPRELQEMAAEDPRGFRHRPVHRPGSFYVGSVEVPVY